MGFIDKYKQNQEKRQQRYEERKKEIRMKRVSTEKETVIKVFKKHNRPNSSLTICKKKVTNLTISQMGKNITVLPRVPPVRFFLAPSA